MRIIHEAYHDEGKKDFYKFLRGLDATRASLSKGTTVIIDEEYPIVDNLKLPERNSKVDVTQDITE